MALTMTLFAYVLIQLIFACLTASSAQWIGMPQPYEYPENSEKEAEPQPVFWEQYYSDIEYEDEEGKYARRLPEPASEERDRRRQVTCEVIKHREYFSDPEYDFMPSTYVNTTCVERTECDPSFNDNSDRKQMCVIRTSGCRTNFKEMTVFKKRKGHHSEGWRIHKVQKVAVGCCDHN